MTSKSAAAIAADTPAVAHYKKLIDGIAERLVDMRCMKCTKLLARTLPESVAEVKCSRCGCVNLKNGSEYSELEMK